MFGLSGVRRGMSVQARAQVHGLWTGGATTTKMSQIECDAEVDIVAMISPAGMKYAGKLYVFFSLPLFISFNLPSSVVAPAFLPRSSRFCAPSPSPLYHVSSQQVLDMFVSLDYVTEDLHRLAYSAQLRMGRRHCWLNQPRKKTRRVIFSCLVWP